MMLQADGRVIVAFPDVAQLEDRLARLLGNSDVDGDIARYLYPRLCETFANDAMTIHRTVASLLDALGRAYAASGCDLAITMTSHVALLFEALIQDETIRGKAYGYWLNTQVTR